VVDLALAPAQPPQLTPGDHPLLGRGERRDAGKPLRPIRLRSDLGFAAERLRRIVEGECGHGPMLPRPGRGRRPSSTGQGSLPIRL